MGQENACEADEAVVACAVVDLMCLLVGGIVRCVCVHGRTCVDGGCARRQYVSDWSCVWRGVGEISAGHMPRPQPLMHVVVVMEAVVNPRAAGRERAMWVVLTRQWLRARL